MKIQMHIYKNAYVLYLSSRLHSFLNIKKTDHLTVPASEACEQYKL